MRERSGRLRSWVTWLVIAFTLAVVIAMIAVGAARIGYGG